MLQILKETHVPFSKMRYIGFIVSGSLIVLTLVLLLINGGPNYGIDFLGGSRIGLEFTGEVTTEDIRLAVNDLGETEVKVFRTQNIEGKERYQIQIPPKTELSVQSGEKSFSSLLVQKLEERHPDSEFSVLDEETVSAAFGKELQGRAIWTLLIGLALILIYIAIRINLRFGIGTVAAVFHDVWVTLGIITLLGIRIDVTVIAAFLTLIGYSVNDSIVVSKRIQEVIKTHRGSTLMQNVDKGINSTLSRTLVTSLTTMFVAIALVVFAAQTAIFPFAMTMTIGILIGTYSSAFIVAPIVVELERMIPSRKKR